MVIENYEVAAIRRGINDDSFDVLFRQVAYELKAKEWKQAKKEATKLLNEKFPEVVIFLQ